MQKNIETRMAIDFISEFMLYGHNVDDIDEVAVEPSDPNNPESERVVRVFYSAPDAPHPPKCAKYISQGLEKMKITGVQVEYVRSSSEELY